MDGEAQLNDILTLVLGTLGMLVMLVGIIAFAFLFQRKLIKKERAYRDVEKLLQKQELQSAYKLIEGQDEERKRIAAEIHDNVGNVLATLKIFSDIVVEKEHTPEIRLLNIKINDIVEELTKSIRKISHNLDSSTLKNFGLSVALQQLCQAIQDSGRLQISCIVDLQKPIEGDPSLQIYRIVQELFTNTLKHAKASKVRFEITQLNGEISIIHEDNGVGFDPKKTFNSSMGLQNIKSRTTRLNGEIKILSSNSGTTFIIEIPYNAERSK